MMKSMISLSLLLTTPAWAAPQFSSKCEVAKEIRTPLNNPGFFLSADCKTVFVLPPAYGVQTISGRTVGNLERCQEVRELNKILSELNKGVNNAIQGKIDEEALTQFLNARKKIRSEYGDLANTLGASVEMNFDLAVGQNLAKFREMNEGLGINIVPVSVKDMKLGWNQTTAVDPEMRIAFNQSVPVADAHDMGAGSFSARLDLSLFGACSLVDPFTHQLPERIRVNQLSGLITPNIIYKYELGAKYTYVARYNRGALAKKIRESSSSGGFFKTSTASSLIETAKSSGWFSLEMKCDDSRVCDQAKTETALQIKQRLMQEVIDGIALAKLGYAVAAAEAGIPGKPGSSVAAAGVRQCFHPYCQAAAIVIDVASAVFGGTSQTDTYISSNNHWAEERVDVTTPVSFTGIMGFKK